MQSFQRFVPVFFLLMTELLFAQAPPACQPNQNQGTSGCATACVRCDFEMILGNTSDNILAPGLPPFCGTFENPEWFRFVAGQSVVDFALSIGACAQNEGVEIAFYDACGSAPIDCFEGPIQSLNSQVTGLIPGREYLVVIDGYNGDLCDYLFHFSDPAMTTAPTPNSTGIVLQGPTSSCQQWLETYSLSAPVPGAAWYTWEAPPGSLINGASNPITLPADAGTSVQVVFGQIGGQVRVTPKTACTSGTPITTNVSIQNNPNIVLGPLYVAFDDTPYFHELSGSTIPAIPGAYQTITVLTTWLGCDSTVRQNVIVLQPEGTANAVVYWDNNNNGTKESNESTYPFGLVLPSSGGEFVSTNTNGQAVFLNLTNGDTIFAPTPPAGTTVNPAFRIYQYPAPPTTYFFGLYPAPNGIDLQMLVSSSQTFRPGFTTTTNIRVQNPQGFYGAVTVRVVKPSWLEYLDATPMPDAVSGDTLVWNVLLSGSDFLATVTYKTPVGTALGTPVPIRGMVSEVPNEYNPFNNEYTLNAVVVGSYDPNDKQVWPPYLLPNDFETPPALEYTIRFQNTGTFPAEFVRLIDTLQESLDPATFEFVASSHPCTWKMYGSGILEFFFENIQLPDSLSDPEGSIGYATFRIKPRPGLEFGDVVQNFADIYFDYNPPIRTNTANTRAVYFVPGEGLAGQGMRLRPNPAAFFLRCSWTAPIPQDGTLRLISLDGIPRLTETVPAGENTWLVDVQQLDPGLYIAVLEAGSTVYVKQVVVIRAAEVRGWR